MIPGDKKGIERIEAPELHDRVNGAVEIEWDESDLEGDEGSGGAYGHPREDDEGYDDQPA